MPRRGFTRVKNRPRPVSVPPEPTPTTKASTSCRICSQISGPVERSCASGIGRIAKLIDVKGARNFLGQPRRHVLVIFRMPARHVANAPGALPRRGRARAQIFSCDILSGMTRMMR